MKRIVIGIVLAVVTIVPSARLRAQGPLDMQSVFVGAANMFPRTGSIAMNQVLSGNTLTFVKFENPAAYEVYSQIRLATSTSGKTAILVPPTLTGSPTTSG